MALITCPECQQQISEHAASCPHCGYPILHQPAEESESVAHDEAAVAPKADLSQTDSRNQKHNKLPVIVACALVVVCVIGSVVFAAIRSAQQQAAAEEAERASLAAKESEEQAALQARAEYIANLESFAFRALTGGAAAEKVCNLTKSVWYNTIYEKYSSDTVAYTQTNGKYHEDFNTSLKKLYSSDEMAEAITLIEENQAAVEEVYKKLLNPEPEFESCFEEVEALYSAYYKFTNLAVSPTGSYTTYSANFSEYDSEFMEHYDKLDLLIPEA